MTIVSLPNYEERFVTLFYPLYESIKHLTDDQITSVMHDVREVFHHNNMERLILPSTEMSEQAQKIANIFTKPDYSEDYTSWKKDGDMDILSHLSCDILSLDGGPGQETPSLKTLYSRKRTKRKPSEIALESILVDVVDWNAQDENRRSFIACVSSPITKCIASVQSYSRKKLNKHGTLAYVKGKLIINEPFRADNPPLSIPRERLDQRKPVEYATHGNSGRGWKRAKPDDSVQDNTAS